MTCLFADTFFYLALLNDRDPAHRAALELASRRGTTTLTTAWVLIEVADAMAGTRRNRETFRSLYEGLRARPDVRIVPFADELFESGIDLYFRRADKQWSLTDCVSFVVMERFSLAEALTGDHHFEQAGFKILFPSK